MSMLSRSFGGNGPLLALRRFKISSRGKVLVDIAGRKPGLFAWLLTKFGLDDETSLKVTNDMIFFKTSSFWGTTYTTIPFSMVSSINCGYTKSGMLLMIGLLLLTLGLPTIIGPIIGIFFLIAYKLSKKITIYIETSGGAVIGLSFKRSVIENVQVDIDQALQVTRIINRQAMLSQVSALKHAFQKASGVVEADIYSSNKIKSGGVAIDEAFDLA